MFVVLSTQNSGRAPRSFMTGPLVKFEPGRWLIVESEEGGRARAVALADSTTYEGPDCRLLDPTLLTPGVRVQVSYRLAGDAHPIVERVRVLAPRGSPP